MMKTNEKKISKIQSPLSVGAMLESIVGCKWSLRVMQLVREEVKRPGEMQRRTPGLSAKVLNERLNKLMRFGIL
ncbi:MAG: winged helix-turn-helix transcriptional regulator, partial [Nitrospiria bacterium]